jgi:hypothetical protein
MPFAFSRRLVQGATQRQPSLGLADSEVPGYCLLPSRHSLWPSVRPASQDRPRRDYGVRRKPCKLPVASK